MEQSNTSLVNVNSDTQGQDSSKRVRYLRRKKDAASRASKKKPTIFWHVGKNGQLFRYNLEIANRCGINAALIAEETRYWSLQNFNKAQKKKLEQKHPAYSMYRRGHEMAEKFGFSKATYWRALNGLKEEGIIKVDEFQDYCGMMNLYSITPKYFEIAGLETITRIEREIFYPNKEDVSNRDSVTEIKTENVQEKIIAENTINIVTETTEVQTEFQEIFQDKIDVFQDDFQTQNTPPESPGFWNKVCFTMRQGLSHAKSDFWQNLNDICTFGAPHNRDVNNIVPPTPIKTHSEKSDFVETEKGVWGNQNLGNEIASCTAQESVKISLPKKRKPNERKKHLKAERKVRSPDRLQALECFEAFHGFSNSVCRDKHEEFFAAYPKKADKEASANAFIRLLFSQEISFDDLMKRVKIFAQSEKVKKCLEVEQGRFIKNPANWLRDKVWLEIKPDEPKKDFDTRKREGVNQVRSFIASQALDVQPFLKQVSVALTADTFLTWFGKTSLEREQDKLVLKTPSVFAGKTIVAKFITILREGLDSDSLNLLEIRACNAQGHVLWAEPVFSNHWKQVGKKEG